MRRLFSFMAIICFFCLFSPRFLIGYDDETTHRMINKNVAEQSSLDMILKNRIGFVDGLYSTIKGNTIKWWLEDGGEREDDNWTPPPFRPLRHFHDPLEAWDTAGFRDELLGQYDSSLAWALNTVDNDYSWPAARSLFYKALSTGSEDDYANMFRSLGQVMHLISDAAVPAHVRNDPHPGFAWISNDLQEDLYEKWASTHHKENEGLVSYVGKSIDPVIFAKADLNQSTEAWNNPISALWDQNVFTHGVLDPLDTWASDVGLAEFTNVNFVSQDSKLLKYPYPDLLSAPVDLSHPVQVLAEEGKWHNVYYVLHPEKGYRLAILSYTAKDDETVIKYGCDDNVWQDYAAQLIPRAVGYSAALLDYFFRGNIEITAPDSFLYAIIDGSGPHEFSQIKLKVRNTTPDEEMQAGSLIAVARYKKRKDYREDLSTDPPQEISRETAFSYSVSAEEDIDGLSSTEPHPYTFDFSEHPIPAGITDLTLQVVFKGTLGNEKDIAVAVGMKDLYEPMHITTWNSTDYVYINDFSATGEYYGVLATGQQIRDISSLFNAADIDGDGVLNEVSEGEAYIDPHIMTRKLGFSPVGGSTGEYQAVFEDLPPGRYGRVLVLMDAPLFNLKINSISVVPELDEDPSFEISAIVNQENEKFQADQVYLFRGIQQHIWSARAWTIGSNAGIDFANWPPVENADPYPASEIKP